MRLRVSKKTKETKEDDKMIHIGGEASDIKL